MPKHPTSPSRADESPHYDAEAVRGGEIVLRSRRRRRIFVAGLLAWGLVALAGLIAAA